MSYTITNNIMYVRDDTGELVPVSMIASGAGQTIQAIKDTATAAESQIEAKTDEQVARIPEVTTLAEDVSGLKDKIANLGSVLYTPQTLTTDQQTQARENIGAADAETVNGLKDDLEVHEGYLFELANNGKYTKDCSSKSKVQLTLGNINADGSITENGYNGYAFLTDVIANSFVSFDATKYKINAYYEKNGVKKGYTTWITSSPYTLNEYEFDRIGINVRKLVTSEIISDNELSNTLEIETQERIEIIGNLATKEYVDSKETKGNGVLMPYPKDFVSRLKPDVYRVGSKYYTDFNIEDLKISGNTICYVSPSGNGDGSEVNPYGNINTAINSGATTIYLTEGTYSYGTHFDSNTDFKNKNVIGIGAVVVDCGDGTTPIGAKDSCYVENIEFIGGRNSFSCIGDNDKTFCFNGCKFHDSTNNAFSGFGGNYYMYECEAYNSPYDGFNYHKYGTIENTTPNIVEINCKAHDCGDGTTGDSSNASTIHDGASIVRIGGEYYRCYGGVVADKGYDSDTPSYSCNFGVYSHDSTHSKTSNDMFSASFWSQMYCKMWLFDCIASGDSKYEISSYDGAEVYSFGMISDNMFNPIDYSTGGTIVRK